MALVARDPGGLCSAIEFYYYYYYFIYPPTSFWLNFGVHAVMFKKNFQKTAF